MIGRLIKGALGWATSGSLWPVGIALAAGVAVGVGLTAWGASYIVDGAEKAEAAAEERAGFLAALVVERDAAIASRDASINSLSHDIETLTAAASASHAEATRITRAAEGRVRAVEARLSTAQKEQANVGPSKPLNDVTRGALVWMRCVQDAGDDPARAARCSNQARLPAD